jgi:hypothetical protein
MIGFITRGALEPNIRSAIKPSSNYRNFAKYITFQHVKMKG